MGDLHFIFLNGVIYCPNRGIKCIGSVNLLARNKNIYNRWRGYENWGFIMCEYDKGWEVINCF